jgi:hypothetical protein
MQVRPNASLSKNGGLRYGWGNDFAISLDLRFLKSTLNVVYVYFGQQF